MFIRFLNQINTNLETKQIKLFYNQKGKLLRNHKIFNMQFINKDLFVFWFKTILKFINILFLSLIKIHK